MTIKITFKHFPAAGKFIRCEKRRTTYWISRSEPISGTWPIEYKRWQYRIPKFFWNKL